MGPDVQDVQMYGRKERSSVRLQSGKIMGITTYIIWDMNIESDGLIMTPKKINK